MEFNFYLNLILTCNIYINLNLINYTMHHLLHKLFKLLEA